MRGYLAIKDVGLFSGEYYGCEGSFSGEVAYFRSRSFCWDVLTDPAYHKKIVITDRVNIEGSSSYPVLEQSLMPHLSAMVFLGQIKRDNRESDRNGLRKYLSTNRIGGFIPDRRDLLHDALNFAGNCTAGICDNPDRASDVASKPVSYQPEDLKSISAPHEYLWDLVPGTIPAEQYNIVVWDFGTSYNLLKILRENGCGIRVVPPDTHPEDIVALRPDGIVISGRPLSPENAGKIIPRIERVVGIRPLLGIGGGAVTLAQALGVKTYDLKTPHHGTAVAIEDTRSGTVSATYQSHSICPDRESLEKSNCEITHLNVCDDSVEGYFSDEYRAIGSLYTDIYKEKPHFLNDFHKLIGKSITTF
ncbi:MAG: carbamoyl-phosphate synthase domain-containing protein [candidate division Zixibacteria bacterium]